MQTISLKLLLTRPLFLLTPSFPVELYQRKIPMHRSSPPPPLCFFTQTGMFSDSQALHVCLTQAIFNLLALAWVPYGCLAPRESCMPARVGRSVTFYPPWGQRRHSFQQLGSENILLFPSGCNAAAAAATTVRKRNADLALACCWTQCSLGNLG